MLSTSLLIKKISTAAAELAVDRADEAECQSGNKAQPWRLIKLKLKYHLLVGPQLTCDLDPDAADLAVAGCCCC